jgi:hypothetical protein
MPFKNPHTLLLWRAGLSTNGIIGQGTCKFCDVGYYGDPAVGPGCQLCRHGGCQLCQQASLPMPPIGDDSYATIACPRASIYAHEVGAHACCCPSVGVSRQSTGASTHPNDQFVRIQ